MRSRILVSLVALAVATQSCCCCTILGGPQPPYPITPSDEAVSRFQERMNEAQPGPDGSFTVTITDEEMTSLVAQMLDRRETPPPFSDTQVHFRNDRVEVYAAVHVVKSLSLPGLVAFRIGVTGGEATVIIEEVALGPLPVPKAILETLSEMLNETLTQNIRVDGQEVLITGVEIGDGEMTITAQAPLG